jgi:GrpB-like predicted nucleotidyltransferase (UPF0157 family)/ribosomal protein S18 acetylase RimI-like enzyme
MMPQFVLQPAGAAAIPLLLHLIHAAFEEMRGRLDPPSGAHAETAGSLQALFDQGERAVLTTVEGAAVGCVFFVRTGVEMYMHRLAILPAYRGRGIGRALMTCVEEQALQEGCAYGRVGVRLALTSNLTFFERLGYSVIAQDNHAGYRAPTFAHMVKELGPQMMRVVEVAPYDAQWPARFAHEAAAVRAALGDAVVAIEHVGSTSVPGLAAKPVIDMMPLLRDIRDANKGIAAMAASGYIPRGEFGLPGRSYFVKGSAHARLVHCHAYAFDHPEVERHLAFRDYLRTHAAARRAYAALKIELAQKHPTDIVAYMDGKDGLIKQLEAEALRWRRAKALT